MQHCWCWEWHESSAGLCLEPAAEWLGNPRQCLEAELQREDVICGKELSQSVTKSPVCPGSWQQELARAWGHPQGTAGRAWLLSGAAVLGQPLPVGLFLSQKEKCVLAASPARDGSEGQSCALGVEFLLLAACTVSRLVLHFPSSLLQVFPSSKAEMLMTSLW